MEQLIPFGAGGREILVRDGYDKQHNPAVQYLTRFSGESRRVAHSRLKWVVKVTGSKSIHDTSWTSVDRMFSELSATILDRKKLHKPLNSLNRSWHTARHEPDHQTPRARALH
jgi:hypothetical protein